MSGRTWLRLTITFLAALSALRPGRGAAAHEPGLHPAPTPQPPATQPGVIPDELTTLPADHPQRSAWTTMKVFLIRVGEAESHPDRIQDAIKCMDLTRLDPDVATDRGPRLAEELAEIIGFHGVTLDRIPDDWHAPPYIYLSTKDGEIVLARQDDNRWRFTSQTVASIPVLYQEVRRAATTQRAEAAASVSAERRSARSAMAGFLDAIRRSDFESAAEFLDTSKLSDSARENVAPSLAAKLGLLVNRVREGVIEEIPDEAAGLPYVWYAGDHGRIEIARQEGVERKGEWLFTAKTVDSIEPLYRAFEDRRAAGEPAYDFRTQPKLWLRSKIPSSLKIDFLGLQRWQWIGLGLVLFLGAVAGRLASRILRGLTRRQFFKARVQVPDELHAAAVRPLAMLAMVGTWWLGLQRLLDLDVAVEDTLKNGVQFVVTIVGVWAAFRLTDLMFAYVAARPTHAKLPVAALLVPLLRKSVKIVIGAMGLIFVARAVGMRDADVNKILAGLGLGGLAFTLAAQDTIRNFFGSFVIVLDPPFQIGDWIKIGDLEGRVESVGLRSLRLRTVHDSQVTIPNSNLISASVDNLGARRYRRLRCAVAINPGTRPALVEAFCEGVRELIRRHPNTRHDELQVWVHDLSGKSIEITVECQIETRRREVEQRSRHRLLLDIVRLARRLGVDFAETGGTHETPEALQTLANLSDQPEEAEKLGRREAEAIVALIGAYGLAEVARPDSGRG